MKRVFADTLYWVAITKSDDQWREPAKRARDALGDVILSTPSLRAIRRQFPKAHITQAVGRSAYEVVARCPYVDDLLIYDPTRKDRGLLGHLAFRNR